MYSEQYVLDQMIENGYMTEAQLDQAKVKVDNDGGSLLEAIYALKICTEQDIVQMLADEYGRDTFDFDAQGGQVQQEIIDILSPEVANRYHIIPLSLSNGVLRVAMDDPGDIEALDAVRYMLRVEVEGLVASHRQIMHALQFYYPDTPQGGNATMDAMLATEDGATLDVTTGNTVDATSDAEGEATDEEDTAPIIRLVSLIILEAFRTRASDIHIEPMEKRFRIRYRIDGVLTEVENPPKYLQNQILSRLKLQAGMNLSEHRIPQDGRIRFSAMGRDLDLRVSDLPTTWGESIVMRILDKSGVMIGISELGFFPDDQERIDRIIHFPDGIFLVTGPTGSGKTTSLYSFLHALNQPVSKIITAEDPVEYELSGINQVQINPDVQMTFANALRAMLRQAPNIIMVGEIRDEETGEIAINAALTGHLVFSTLHTNDAPSTITRLIDMGIKPFLVASSLRAIMAQRLVRRLCKYCSQEYEITDDEATQLDLTDEERKEMKFRKPVGCTECKKGYKGRMGIYEIFILDDSVQELIYQMVDASVIRKRAREIGMHTLREDALRKAGAGLTSITECIRLTVSEG